MLKLKLLANCMEADVVMLQTGGAVGGQHTAICGGTGLQFRERDHTVPHCVGTTVTFRSSGTLELAKGRLARGLRPRICTQLRRWRKRSLPLEQAVRRGHTCIFAISTSFVHIHELSLSQ